MHDPRDSSVHDLLLKIVTLLIDHNDVVQITTTQVTEGACFSINVDPEDVGKLIGKQGRTARSLRTIISAIGMKLQRRYALDIVEGN